MSHSKDATDFDTDLGTAEVEEFEGECTVEVPFETVAQLFATKTEYMVEV